MSRRDRVMAAMRAIGAPATASQIARRAKLSLATTIIALNRLCDEGVVVRTMPSWGVILYKIER